MRATNVSETFLAPSRAELGTRDSWHGVNWPVLEQWAEEPQPLRPPAAPPLARTKQLTGFQILATGSYAPDTVIRNDDLQRTHGFDPQWIAERTGIRQRRHAAPEQAASDLGAEAARRCLEAARVPTDEVDLLIVATHTPDLAMPGAACLIQEKLGLFCGAFDVQAACSGFMMALATGAQFVRTGNARRCLVVGTDVSSRIVNPADQGTYPLFGDGAGAVLLGAGSSEQGFLAYQLGTDGSGAELLGRPAGGSRTPLTAEALRANAQYFRMNGRAVFRWAIETVSRSIRELLQAARLTIEDVQLFVPHQANQRILAAIGERLGMPAERIYSNVERYGNTMAGSIPLALDEARAEGRIQRGERIVLSGFGAGLSWGSALLHW